VDHAYVLHGAQDAFVSQFFFVTGYFSFLFEKTKEDLWRPIFPLLFLRCGSNYFFLVFDDIRSLPRFFSTLIPVHWALALWFGKKSYLKFLVLLLFIILLAFGTILFVNWYHFV